MKTTCPSCTLVYDDTTHWTYCPHDRFISDEVAARKDLGYRLLGKQVTLAPLTAITTRGPSPVRRVESVTREGYVTLSGIPGRVAPEVLHIVD